MVLKEPTGKFGPQVGASLFRPDNVYVEVLKTGKLTSDHFEIWLKNVFFPNVETKSLLLIDSWTGHCSDAVKSVKHSDKDVEVTIIPRGTTGNIQSLDVFGFKVWKNCVKHFSDSVILHSDNLNLHKQKIIMSQTFFRRLS
ncbi:hypothetical protein PV326_009538 [Microctonus aethiopoides]|nr:hypothetical protein PV326_009538 [Microctonus aethiopoides]